MPAALSPLPNASGGLPSRVVNPQIWDTLPVTQQNLNSKVPSPLPVCPVFNEKHPRTFPGNWSALLAMLPAAEDFAGTGIQPVTLSASKHITTPEKAADAHTADFTDEDLRHALEPLIGDAFRHGGHSLGNSSISDLEPMLRATIRRALAEHSPTSRPFRTPAVYDRLIWHLQALISSRTYEDILFEKTHRFQVEEVYLLDVASLALISFASCDPARHSSVKKVTPTVHGIVSKLRTPDGKLSNSVELPDHRNAIACHGTMANLVAVVRGQPSELILPDLNFALKRIEERFSEQFKAEGSPLLLALQPFLEDCLLIQAPSSTF